MYPIYTLALLKSPAFRSGDASSDVRVFYMRLLKSLSVADCIALLYPRLLSLHDLDLSVSPVDSDGVVQLPPFIRVSYERLDVDGVYLIGIFCFIQKMVLCFTCGLVDRPPRSCCRICLELIPSRSLIFKRFFLVNSACS